MKVNISIEFKYTVPLPIWLLNETTKSLSFVSVKMWSVLKNSNVSLALSKKVKFSVKLFPLFTILNPASISLKCE